MKKIPAIIVLFFFSFVNAQKKEVLYNNIDGLIIPDSINSKDITGSFYISDGFGGYEFQLDSNMKFHKIDFSCEAKFIIDSGSWKINNHHTAVVISGTKKYHFDIIRFDQFYFLILPSQRQKFIKDLLELKYSYKKVGSFVFDNKTYTVNYLIGYSLIKKYYAKEIESNPGI
jgi:hypothetical protein